MIYQMPLESRDIKASMIKLVLEHLDAGDPLPLVAYYLGDGAVERGNLAIAVSRKRMHLFEGRGDVDANAKREAVVLRLAPQLYARAVTELYLSGVGVLLDVLHSHKWLAFKRLAAQNLAGFQLAGRYVKLSSARGLQGRVSFRTREEAERYAEAARRELEKLGIYAVPKVTSDINHQVVFNEKTLRRLAKVDEAVKLAIERLEILSTPRTAAKPIIATRLDAKPERPVKPKIETKHEELPRTVEPKAAAKREERPKTTAPKAADKIAFQLADGPAAMRLKLTYVMKGDRKIPTINAATRFSTLEEAEEFRRRLRLSGINASVISKGATGYEVTVPKDELEKLTPEEKEAIKQYLEHLTQTRDEEKRKAAEEVLRRFDLGAKAVNIGGVRLKLAHDRGRIKAEKYGDPQLIAEIKTALENKLRETLGDEFEQWKNHIKTKERGRRLIITQQLLERLAQQDPNTAKTLNEKT
jgi:hypothetical protein